MKTTGMGLPRAVSRAEWLAARDALLIKEKEATRARDAFTEERRRLPMVKIEKDYVFAGPNGKASPLDLFEGRRQLIISHFMRGVAANPTVYVVAPSRQVRRPRKVVS